MSEVFVPLVALGGRPRDAHFTPLSPKETPSSAQAGAVAKEAAGSCSEPTVTLQRNGEFVTGIRIQCTCGKVIDLTCIY